MSAPIHCPLGPEYAPGGGLLVPRDVTDRIFRALNGESVPEPYSFTLNLDGPARIDSDETREDRIGRELIESCESLIESARARAGHGPSKLPDVLAWQGVRATECERDALVKAQNDWRNGR